MKPFLKWAGGKTKLLPQLRENLPVDFADRVYVEPFLGGGALFFANGLAAKAAVLSDANAPLINTYLMVRDQVDLVIRELRGLDALRVEDAAAAFTRVRAAFNECGGSQRAGFAGVQAARFIYLNKTCFNGLWRVNQRGAFNVPNAHYAKPVVCDEETLRAASKMLKPAGVIVGDFSETLRAAKPRDFFYLDPPYVPVSPTSNFTAYTREGFGDPAHRELAKLYQEASARGAKLLLSNSDTPLVRELYADFYIQEVLAPRAINSKGAGRGKVKELLIRNYRT